MTLFPALARGEAGLYGIRQIPAQTSRVTLEGIKNSNSGINGFRYKALSKQCSQPTVFQLGPWRHGFHAKCEPFWGLLSSSNGASPQSSVWHSFLKATPDCSGQDCTIQPKMFCSSRAL